jgi:hypothetical protein
MPNIIYHGRIKHVVMVRTWAADNIYSPKYEFSTVLDNSWTAAAYVYSLSPNPAGPEAECH